MALYAVLLLKPTPEIETSIKSHFPGTNYFQVNSTQWIVSGKGTAQNISDTIGITGAGDTTIGSGVVLAFSGYWGRASTDLWEWMKTKIEEG